MPSTSRTRTIAGAFGALLAAAWLLSPSTAVATAAIGADQSATVKVDTNVRAQPNTSSTILTTLPAGTAVNVECWTLGEPTYGNDQSGAMWLYVSLDGWVHSYLVTPVEVSPCGEGAGVLPAVPGAFYLNCDAARAANADPVYADEPGYGPHLDADNDGIGCERAE